METAAIRTLRWSDQRVFHSFHRRGEDKEEDAKGEGAAPDDEVLRWTEEVELFSRGGVPKTIVLDQHRAFDGYSNGLALWDSALVLGRFMERHVPRHSSESHCAEPSSCPHFHERWAGFNGRLVRVLELGSGSGGCGFMSALCLAESFPESQVDLVVSDHSDVALTHLREQVDRNSRVLASLRSVAVQKLSWGNEADGIRAMEFGVDSGPRPFDVVLAADVCYDPTQMRNLLATIAHVSSAETRIYVFAEGHVPDALKQFRKGASQRYFSNVCEVECLPPTMGDTDTEWMRLQLFRSPGEVLFSKAEEATSTDSVYSLIHSSAERGLLGTVQDICSASIAQVSRVNATGDTPLHVAARSGHLDVVAYLLSVDADDRLTNNQGETPEDIARRRGHAHVVRVFAQHREALWEDDSDSDTGSSGSDGEIVMPR
jgi:Lysine methyltransferase/Ankyrin repeats (3 copies)